MKKFIIISIICSFIVCNVSFAYDKHYIKNSKGQTTGYTKTYSNGKTVQYNKKGQVEYTYKKRFYRQNNKVFQNRKKVRNI